MIEHLRKYTFLIIVVLAFIFVGLTFLNKSASRSGGENPVVLTVNGTSLTLDQYQKLEARTERKFFSFAQQAGFTMLVQKLYFDNYMLSTMGNLVLDPQTAPVTALLVKRQAAAEFGIQPSDEEITTALKSYGTGPNGEFDQEKYNRFVQQDLPRNLGMGEADLREIVRDLLISERLHDLIGAGLTVGEQFERDSAESTAQRLTIEMSKLLRATYEQDIHPTDDELKTEWETEKAAHMTAKKIRISYVLATPAFPEPPKPDEPLPPTATEEEKKADAAKKAIQASADAEQKRKIKREMAGKVSALLDGIEKSSGDNFDALAKEQGFEVKTTDLFTLEDLPPELKDLRPRDPMTPGVPAVLSRLTTEGSATNRFSGSVALENDRFLIARAEEIQEPREKTFEEAKAEILASSTAKRASEAMKKDATEKVAKLRESIAAGKSFEDAAKDLGLTVTHHGPFSATPSRQDPASYDAEAAPYFEELAAADPGTVADPIIHPDSAALVFVEKREIYKDPARDQQIEQAGRRDAQQAGESAFIGWLLQRHQQSKIVSLFHRK